MIPAGVGEHRPNSKAHHHQAAQDIGRLGKGVAHQGRQGTYDQGHQGRDGGDDEIDPGADDFALGSEGQADTKII